MTIHPSLISAGGPSFISPDGKIPTELWAEYAAIVLLEPEPELLGTWIRNLEDGLGVTEDHRSMMRTHEARIPAWMDEPDTQAPIDAPKWYAVITSLRAEKRAALAIGDALRTRDPWNDLAVYLPCEIRWVRHARRKDIVTRPLFARYLFVCIRPEHMHLVKDADGVQDFVRSGGRPLPFPPTRLHEIRAAEQSGEYDLTRGEVFEGPFTTGDAVEVKLGKMSGWPGRVLKMTAENRVRVLLSMFGKEHVKELDVGEVRAA